MVLWLTAIGFHCCSFGFSGWAAATVRAEQRLVLAHAHRAVKLEGAPGSTHGVCVRSARTTSNGRLTLLCFVPELRERVFRQWHDLAQQSRTLRERCAAVLQQRRRARLEYAFDVWREGSLRRGEEVVVRRREGRECREAWEWWKARTKVREYSRPVSAGNGAARL